MKERPILFTPENAKKVHLGTKTQTRRVVKPQPSPLSNAGIVRCEVDSQGFIIAVGDGWTQSGGKSCPYGIPGDRLWVREAFTYWEDPGYDWKPTRKEPRFEYLSAKRQDEICERASTAGNDYLVYKADGMKRSLGEWNHTHPIYEHCIGRFDKTISAIHMPRWACRTVLELTAVRVERLQEISVADCLAEGIGPRTLWEVQRDVVDVIGPYKQLWESINGKSSWALNPWIWVLEFRKVQ